MTISEVFFCGNKWGRLCAAYRIPGCNAHPDEKNASPFTNPCLSFFICGLIAVRSLWDSEVVGESHADDINVNERQGGWVFFRFTVRKPGACREAAYA